MFKKLIVSFLLVLAVSFGLRILIVSQTDSVIVRFVGISGGHFRAAVFSNDDWRVMHLNADHEIEVGTGRRPDQFVCMLFRGDYVFWEGLVGVDPEQRVILVEVSSGSHRPMTPRLKSKLGL